MYVKIDHLQEFKSRALNWASKFNYCCVLDSNNYQEKYSNFDFLIATHAIDKLEVINQKTAYDEIRIFRNKHKQWIFGGFSYDLKNASEQLFSKNEDQIEFPLASFFVPKHLLIVKNGLLEIISPEAEKIYNEILQAKRIEDHFEVNFSLKSKLSQSDYIRNFNKIKHHIKRGDIYIANYCIEFFADNASFNPIVAYQKLNAISPAPFSSFYKCNDKYILTCSPERFIAKRQNKIISQPIKGTAKRSDIIIEDEIIKTTLKFNPKEQQENVMIVDLVRNDLTKIAKRGSVKVEELFGIYSFKQVHQMISTVICEASAQTDDIEIINSTFPMGSMTGAPKVSAMQIIENTEISKRGIFSGAIGYFNPSGDFDFNVVIRSVQYNREKKFLSFMVGSAITYYANAENEYEECLLKAKAIFELFNYKA